MNRRAVLGLVLVAAAGSTAQAQSPAPAPRPPEVAAVQAGSLAVLQPWSRATPGGAKVGAGYVTIENHGTVPDRLLGAESDLSDSADVHETVTEGGVARMKPTGGVTVAPHGRVELKPGGYHLMFTGLRRPLKDGESFSATLVFEKAGRVPVTFAVRGVGAGGGTAHQHH